MKNSLHILLLLILAQGIPTLASADFHSWIISEVFSDDSGAVQFIEFINTDKNGEDLLSGETLASNSSMITFPSNLPNTQTLNKHFLVATATYAALPGVPAPDYFIPEGFLQPTGDSINYADGTDQISFGPLPSDGVSSINRNGVPSANTPTNFAGVSGSIVPGGSGLPSAANSSVTVTFDNAFTGCFDTGAPFNVWTVAPDGSGPTLEELGIHITVILRDANNLPCTSVPASEILLTSPTLCLQPGANTASSPTNSTGITSFAGSLGAGGCAESLEVTASGVLIDTIPVRVNSPDSGTSSPCLVDASDLGHFSTVLGSRCGTANYSICFDFNGSGVIDASDLARFAKHLGL